MEKTGPLVQFNKYIPKNKSDITAEDAMSSCCLDNRCEKKDEED